jgi:exosortase A-associated hydrolase 1
LAADYALTDLNCDHVLLWAPVSSGEQHLTQFLRLKLANQMLAAGGANTTGTRQMRQQLESGNAVEIAGYRLSPALALPMAQAKLSALMRQGLVVDWFELQGGEDRPLPPVVDNLAAEWRSKGSAVNVHRVAGDAFWTTQEITDVPTLWEATLRVLDVRQTGALASAATTAYANQCTDAEVSSFACPPARLASCNVHASYVESALIVMCQAEALPAVVVAPSRQHDTGVLVVVGGPQYRAGSHRQFTLLTRAMAAGGVPAMRFDYRGMGDASGPLHMFEQVTDDLRAAIDAFFQHQPALRHVAIWGLCDAASAALFYAWRDARVSGLVLVNPWVRTDAGLAQAYVKHYYRQRLFSREFWRKILRGGVDIRGALAGFLSKVREARLAKPTHITQSAGAEIDRQLPLPERMAEGLARFAGRVMFILSGDDLTAAEFRETVNASPRWRGLLQADRVRMRELAAANHTFSRREWRELVEQWTLEWVRE